jgi:hypothetical protein
LKRINTTTSLCAIRARIAIRNELKREPTITEVRECLQGDSIAVTHKDISAAFRAGEEVRLSL